MRVLVACEFSDVVRSAFASLGHDAWSVDLLPTEGNDSAHIQGDAIEEAYRGGYDLIVAHPPCTDLCASGARWWAAKGDQARDAAVRFALALYSAPCRRVAIENPVGRLSTLWRKPDQIIQPWQHGHPESKATCLWLRGLPALTPTDIVDGREEKCLMASRKDRWMTRSRTLPGIAKAMAEQWGRSV